MLVMCYIDICSGHWGSDNCYTNSKQTIAHIGQVVNNPDDLINVASTAMTFYGDNSLLNLEYTVNSLALHDHIVVDLTGHGLDNVCALKIRIPSDNDSVQSWDNWRNPSRLYRCWKLRTKGFTAINQTTSDYIIEQTKLAIAADNGNGFKSFCCKTVIKAKRYDGTTGSCTYDSEIVEMCTAASTVSRQLTYDAAFREDFEDYWTDSLTLQYMILKCVQITTSNNSGMY